MTQLEKKQKFLLQSINARNVVLTSEPKETASNVKLHGKKSNAIKRRKKEKNKHCIISVAISFSSLRSTVQRGAVIVTKKKIKKTKRTLNRKKNWKKKKKSKMAVARCGVNCFKIVVYSFLLFLFRHTFMIDKIVQGWRKFTIRISTWFRLNKRLRSSYTVFPSMLERFLVERLICNKEAVDEKKKTRWDF